MPERLLQSIPTCTVADTKRIEYEAYKRKIKVINFKGLDYGLKRYT